MTAEELEAVQKTIEFDSTLTDRFTHFYDFPRLSKSERLEKFFEDEIWPNFMMRNLYEQLRKLVRS